MRHDSDITKSQGNIFLDLGFSSAEAENLTTRSDLMCELKLHIESKSLSRKQAAKVFGVTRPRINDLMEGRIDLFSIGMLVDMAASAGLRVQVSIIKPGPWFYIERTPPATPHKAKP